MNSPIRVFKIKTEEGIRVDNFDNDYDAKRCQHLNDCYEMTGDELDVFGDQVNWAGSWHRTEVDGDSLATAVVTHSVVDQDEIFQRNEKKYTKQQEMNCRKGISKKAQLALFCSVFDWPLVCLFGVSLVVIVVLEFTEIRFPYVFFSSAEKINSFIQNISYSFLSATIFYFFCVVGKTYRELMLCKQRVAKELFGMLEDSAKDLKLLGIEADVKYKGEFPSKEELKQILERVDPNETSKRASIVGAQFIHISWFDTVFSMVQRTAQSAIRIIDYLYLFDRKDFDLLASLEDMKDTPAYSLMKGHRPEGSVWPDNLLFYYDLHLRFFLENLYELKGCYDDRYEQFLLK